DRCVIGPNGHVGARTSIGPDGLLHAGVKIGDDVQIGARVILHFNACIGPDGFSFVTPELGSVESAKASGRVDALTTSLTRIHSLGSVELGDDVEIGANSTIDRGTLDNTRIGHGTKLDDLVMVGHNCQIGENCLLCGQVGLAGSVEVGNRVVLAGCVGVADHRKIGDDSIVGMRSGVGTDIPPRSVYVGYPAQPRSDWLKQILNLKRLGRLYKDVADLKKALDSPSS
ncbi:MAG: UDP-3-O-(3-hydroxymyristoyl)glucosamine N-acyltransferase, partial [Rhodospirillaceae bacterium]